jgi:energy-coupling factor transporter ATP-binding protein EcfA2
MTAGRQTAGVIDANPAEFIETARACFERAALAAGGVHERTFQLGEQRVLLRFAGEQLIPLMERALAHREVPAAATPGLTVCFFDSESTGVRMAPPPWDREEFTGFCEINGYNEGDFQVTYDLGADILQCLDRRRGLAVYWTPSWRRIPWWEQSFPLRPILNWWMKYQDFQPVHAAAVGAESGGLLITGPSGSGKSTTTLSCLGKLGYAGDDYVLVRTHPSPHVYSLYNTAKIELDNLHRFPQLKPYISNPDRLDTEKALIFLQEHEPEAISAGFPIRAIVVPKVTGLPDTSIERASSSVALVALAPTTTMHLRTTRRETLAKLFRLVKSVPCYRLLAGTDLAQIPVTLSNLLQQLESAAPEGSSNG